ncbi:inositol monophosphatase 2 isoform X2 [Ailuropoda melanoleuca]|uniref:inositol monophosphatase 2 isoform X2 n=1 Tax=Ailuropoda melanoleuca TaxID=9646 RepID=UPI001494E01F|nr:inositol monophosphatase 2 isoform X2 [Ailuropoda melanoleuca]
MKPSGEDQAAPAGGPWEDCFEAAVQLALRAGQIIRKALSEEKRVSTKTSAADLVTETDHLVEGLIISELQERFPSHRFIAEESAAAGAKCVLTPSPTWIVDPIDGTCNFVHRFPTVAVSIGFAVDQELEFGVIYHCTEERLYTGRRGRGAFCNGQRLQVSGETVGETAGRRAAHPTEVSCLPRLSWGCLLTLLGSVDLPPALPGELTLGSASSDLPRPSLRRLGDLSRLSLPAVAELEHTPQWA